MRSRRCFDQLIAEALADEFRGWDFSRLTGRMIQDAVSWDYRQRARKLIGNSNSLLDVDTGGGEVLASVRPFPAKTVATEGYAPNVPIARRSLEPLGVQVVELGTSDEHDYVLPFADGEFDLILNRHGSFSADEFFRVLKADGVFISQQVGGRNNVGLNEALSAPSSEVDSEWDLQKACYQLQRAGFTVIDAKEEFPRTSFRDIGALVYYLRAITWQVPNFSVDRYMNQLLAIHETIEENGEFTVHAHRFLVEATRATLSAVGNA